jgi:hypothetical protein
VNLLLLAGGWTAFALLGRSWWQMIVAVFSLGGLNYQIEHHLFPSMPRPNLRQAQAPVRAFCAERGIPYAQAGSLASYAQVLRHLDVTGAPRARDHGRLPPGPRFPARRRLRIESSAEAGSGGTLSRQPPLAQRRYSFGAFMNVLTAASIARAVSAVVSGA